MKTVTYQERVASVRSNLLTVLRAAAVVAQDQSDHFGGTQGAILFKNAETAILDFIKNDPAMVKLARAALPSDASLI